MAKKKVKRKLTKSSKPKPAGKDIEKLNSILVENFVNLQKAMTNLAVKFESLSDQISKLLQLFEISAKSFSEKLSGGLPTDIEKDKEYLEKLNKLLEQNKVIAKGITLMEGKIRGRMESQARQPQMRRMPLMRPQPSPSQSQPPQGYLPSSLEKKKPRTMELPEEE